MELKKKVVGAGAGILAAVGIVYLRGGEGKLKEFEVFESAEGRFSVCMPGEPVKVIETVKSSVGDLEFTMFAADSKKFGFLVGYSDYPEEVFLGSDIMEMMGRVAGGVAADVKGELVNEAMLEDYSRAAMEYQVNVPDKGILTSRLIVDGRRLYQVIAMFPVDGLDEAKMVEFFGSFKVND